MTILILGVLVILLFLLGLSLTVNAFKAAPDPAKMVDRKEADALRDELDVTKGQESELRLKIDKLVIELDKTRDELKGAQKSGQDVSVLQQKENDYHNEIENLKRTLDFVRGKADSLAEESIQVIQDLKEKNDSLIATAESKNAGDLEQLKVLEEEKGNLQNQVDSNLEQIGKLQEQLAAHQSSNSELDQSQKRIAVLSDENQGLKEGLAQINQKIVGIEQEIENTFKSNNEQLAEAHQTIAKLEKEIAELESLRSNNAAKIESFETQMKEQDSLVLAQENQDSAMISSVASENVFLESEGAGFKQQLIELKKSNEELLAREKFLQFELIKSQTKAKGLEKICAEFKVQLEQTR